MDLKKLLYKMLVKYYLSDNIKAPFENFVLGLRNAWAGPARSVYDLRVIASFWPIYIHMWTISH